MLRYVCLLAYFFCLILVALAAFFPWIGSNGYQVGLPLEWMLIIAAIALSGALFSLFAPADRFGDGTPHGIFTRLFMSCIGWFCLALVIFVGRNLSLSEARRPPMYGFQLAMVGSALAGGLGLLIDWAGYIPVRRRWGTSPTGFAPNMPSPSLYAPNASAMHIEPTTPIAATPIYPPAAAPVSVGGFGTAAALSEGPLPPSAGYDAASSQRGVAFGLHGDRLHVSAAEVAMSERGMGPDGRYLPPLGATTEAAPDRLVGNRANEIPAAASVAGWSAGHGWAPSQPLGGPGPVGAPVPSEVEAIEAIEQEIRTQVDARLGSLRAAVESHVIGPMEYEMKLRAILLSLNDAGNDALIAGGKSEGSSALGVPWGHLRRRIFRRQA